MKNIIKISCIIFSIIIICNLAIIFCINKVITTPLTTLSFYGLITIIIVKNRFISKDVKINLVIFIGLLLGLEIYLIFFSKKNLSYTERNGQIAYISTYSLHKLWGRKEKLSYKPKSFYEDKKKEFSFDHRFNNLGYRMDYDISFKKEEGVYRILALGDSFTEGVGAPQGYDWPAQLQKILRDSIHNKFEVINTGMSGSDPVNQYLILQKNITLNPDMVILAINNSDPHNIIDQGGLERVHDSITFFKTGPWWEIIYALFRVSRFIFHLKFDQHLQRYKDLENSYNKGSSQMTYIISKMDSVCRNRNILFRVVIIPSQFEMISHKFEPIFGITVEKIKVKIGIEKIIPLHIYYSRLFKTRQISGLPTDYYWPLDYHHNSKGYYLAAKGIYLGIYKDIK